MNRSQIKFRGVDEMENCPMSAIKIVDHSADLLGLQCIHWTTDTEDADAAVAAYKKDVASATDPDLTVYQSGERPYGHITAAGFRA